MSEIYRFAALELGTSLFRIRRGNTVLPVQPQVFDILQYLIANHHRIVSGDEPLEKVWNRQDFFFTGAVAFIERYLRGLSLAGVPVDRVSQSEE